MVRKLFHTPWVLCLGAILLVSCAAPSARIVDEPTAARLSSYRVLPLSFIPNAGQSDPSVRYEARGLGGMLFFREDEIVLSLPTAETESQTARDPALPAAVDPSFAILRLRFDGADAVRLVHSERLPGTVNFLIGNEPSGWRTDLSTYAGIIYEQLYPGIDLRYDGGESTLKGTYTLAPRSDVSRIRWHYEGATSMRVDEPTGDLLIAVGSAGTLVEKAPSAWQTNDGQRVSIPVQYALTDDGTVSFALGRYDADAPLTIDPRIVYGTFVGGSMFDDAKGVAIDAVGNAYLTGRTFSSNLTSGPINGTLHGSSDAYVVKVNAAGTALVYTTYLGGSSDEDGFGNERAGGIAVDASGSAYVTGCTNSTNFPTVNAYQGTHGATTNCDAFVSKLNAAGNGLVYSTFLGDVGSDSGNAIAVDSSGNAFIVGDAGMGFPAVNALMSIPGSGHVFVSKLNPAGNVLLFSTQLGGNGFEHATDVAVDSADNIYVTGATYSTNLPVPNAAQPAYGGGSGDGFVAKIKADYSGLAYLTYLGGSAMDQAYGIALDGLGNAYITGETRSTLNFPTKNAFQPAYGGGRSDAFVTKLNAAGNAWVYSTYLGGSDDENYFNEPGAIAVDSENRPVVTGYTCSPNFPTLGSLQAASVGTCYAFVTRLNAAGSSLAFSTRLGSKSGGSTETRGNDIAVDAQSNVYVVGNTFAADMLTNPLRPYMGMTDGFIVKLDSRFFVYMPLTVR